ncbi:Phosphotyrosine protein phosphatase II [Mycena chlorophos]|uniref:protein-tyrosine-phosphatase n=1 Tax=Mycena chlorophos TaxID=658473 RepID=A0A8H6ST98_MYCCL|nr:Phosphotyrosine protein phosphatase II [Mycena chlorophos]
MLQDTPSPGTQPATATVAVETPPETGPSIAQRRLLLSTQPGLFAHLLPPEEREALATPMHCILPAEGDGCGALYLGSTAAALDIVPLEEKRIRHLVQVIEPPQPVPRENPRDWELEYFRIEIKDAPGAARALAEKLPLACDYIAEALGRGESVLVHCQQGVSRSASVVIAFLIRERAMSYEDALTFVRERRRCARPNWGFVRTLEEWEKTCRLRQLDAQFQAVGIVA